MKKVLVICSHNKWRSKTAETIFKNSESLSVISAGTSTKARRKVSQQLIDWCDKIFVMEKRHREIIAKSFSISSKEIIVLDIPDIYQYMDEELISELQDTIY